MAKSEKEMSYKQIEEAVIRLSPKQLRELERKIWALQMDKLVTKMRRNMRKNKITQQEINRLCEEVRQEMYEKRRQGGC